MRNSRNEHIQTSLLGEILCDADRLCDIIKREDKGLLRARCPGDHRNIVDCHCEDIQLFIDEVRGLGFNSKNIRGETPTITQPITVIPREFFDFPPETIEGEVVGLRLGDVLIHSARERGGILRVSEKLRVDLSILMRPVFQGKKVLLIATGPDVLIETVWYRRFAIDLFQAIAAGNFYAVTGMNFSLFLHECPLGHMINLNKSLLFCEELSERGVSVIPHIYAITDTQRVLWINYLNSHPNIKTILINTQMQRDRASMHEVELTVQALLDKTKTVQYPKT